MCEYCVFNAGYSAQPLLTVLIVTNIVCFLINKKNTITKMQKFWQQHSVDKY